MKDLSARALMVKESSTLAITAKAKALKAAGEDLVAFTAGEPDFDTPEHIKEAAFAAARAGFTKYTATTGIIELRKAICEKLKSDNGLLHEPGQIVVSNGAKHALANAFTALMNEGDEVIFAAPYWLTYTELAALAGAVPKIVNTDKSAGYKPSAAQLNACITEKTKAILINSPNNPSGAVFTEDELKAIAEIAVKHDLYVISDEIYEYLVYGDARHISIAALGKEIFERTIVVNGYSKSYSMTGWRVGYTASNRQIADVIGNIQSHQTSNINTLTQKAAIAAELGDRGFIQNSVAEFAKRKKLMFSMANEIPGFDVLEPQGAFYIFADISAFLGKSVDGKTINSAADFAGLVLEKQKVVLVPCADFGCPNHVRLSYAVSESEIAEGMSRIKAFVSELI